MSARRPALLLFWSWLNAKTWQTERATETWTENRFRHWLAFTLASVLAQKESDWTYWLVCSRALRELTDPLRRAITDPRVELIFEDECPARLKHLPPADRYLITRLDSDDLYDPLTSATLLKQRPTTPFLQFNRGFALDLNRGDVLPWRSRSSPFYAHVYGEQIRHLDCWSEPNHTTVAKSATILGSGHFIVSIHSGNTSTTRAHAGGSPFSLPRGQTILGQFGIGTERSLDDLVATSREPFAWRSRWREIEASQSGVVEAMGRVSPIALYRFACELTRARRTLLVGGGLGSVIARIDRKTSYVEGGDRSDDVVFYDLANGPPDGRQLAAALGAITPTGLLVLAGIHPDHNAAALNELMADVIADRYPEVQRLTTDRDGSECWMLSRVLSSPSRHRATVTD